MSPLIELMPKLPVGLDHLGESFRGRSKALLRAAKQIRLGKKARLPEQQRQRAKHPFARVASRPSGEQSGGTKGPQIHERIAPAVGFRAFRQWMQRIMADIAERAI